MKGVATYVSQRSRMSYPASASVPLCASCHLFCDFPADQPLSLFRVVFLGDLHIRSSDVVFHFRTQKNCGRPVSMESGFFGKTINTCNLQRRPLYRCTQNRLERYTRMLPQTVLFFVVTLLFSMIVYSTLSLFR